MMRGKGKGGGEEGGWIGVRLVIGGGVRLVIGGWMIRGEDGGRWRGGWMVSGEG